MNKDAKIYIAGYRGLVGSNIYRRMLSEGFTNILVSEKAEIDLRDQWSVDHFFDEYRPEYVILAAGKVGGILANSTWPAEFLYDNLMIETNIIHSSYKFGVRKLLNLGSSCIYPRDASQPIREDCLLSGPLENTNRAYSIAKIAGIELCDQYRFQYNCDFISAMPTNLYGSEDNFDLSSSHVLPALIRKFHDAKIANHNEVEIWGTGTPRREFLYVDDLSDALLFLMEHFSAPGPINIGTGEDITIRELAELIARVLGYEGKLSFNISKPDGTPRKLLDVSRLNALGWSATTKLEDGIRMTYVWYCEHLAERSRKVFTF